MQVLSLKDLNIRYPEVQIDKRMAWTEHMKLISDRALAGVTAVSRLMPNVEGPPQAKRVFLQSVVHSRILYAAPSWAKKVMATAQKRCRELSMQRRAALRVARAYRTVSTEAIMVISSLSQSMKWWKIEGTTKKMKTVLLTEPSLGHKLEIKWWNGGSGVGLQETKGRWTYHLIQDVDKWVRRRHSTLTYSLTQVLIDQGCFVYYLWKFKRRSNSKCLYCP